MTYNRFALGFLLAGALSLSLTACGDHDHDNHDNHDNHEHGDEAEVCSHFEGGPYVDATAVAEASGTLPETFEEHHLIRVAMPSGTDTAYVQVTIEETGEFEFWLGKDIPFELLDGTTAIAPESTLAGAKGCESTAVKGLVFDLEAKTYTVKIGPTTETQVTFVIEEHGHSHGDGHSH